MSLNQERRLAVALSYDGNGAPTVTAKGEDWLAEDIIALAEQAGIPVHRDPALAAYLATLDLNETIPRELYLVIAELLAFVYMLDGRYPDEWARLHHKITTSA